MIGLLLFVLGPMVIFIGVLVIIYVGGALATAAPVIVLLAILRPIDWIVGALWNVMTTLMVVVDDFVTGIW